MKMRTGGKPAGKIDGWMESPQSAAIRGGEGKVLHLLGPAQKSPDQTYPHEPISPSRVGSHMSNNPPEKPNRIDPQSPPEAPPVPVEPTPSQPDEVEPVSPDIDEPDTGPDELPPDQGNLGT